MPNVYRKQQKILRVVEGGSPAAPSAGKRTE